MTTTAPTEPSIHLRAFDATSLALSCLRELNALLGAIYQASAHDSEVHALASMGTYVSDNYLEIFDQEAAELLKLLDAARQIASPNKRLKSA